METINSPLGKVVILKLPLSNNEEKKEFYELFRFYDNILFYGIESELAFLQVIILADDESLIGDVKNYKEGIYEISLQEFHRNPETVMIGNKLLMPY